MTDPHTGFIVAAYGITLAFVGATTLWIALRHRVLRRALARFPAPDEPDAERV